MSEKFYIGDNLVDFRDIKTKKPISKVTLMYDDENGFSAGDDTGMELVANCYFATQQLADKALALLSGHQYHAYSGTSTDLDPAAELGDGVTLGGVYSVISRMKDDGFGFPDLSAPGEEELEEEFPHPGFLTQQVKNKVTLGADYYGTRITRANGLENIRIDAEGNEVARAVFNADELAFYAGSERALYFDPTTGRYVFQGDVTVTGSLTMTGTSNWLLTRYSTSKDAAIPDGWSQNWDDSWDNSSTRVWAIYSYDGGSTWSQPMMIQGSDGAQGPQGPSGSSASVPDWVKAYTASAEYDTLVTDEWVVSMNLYGSNIYAGNGSDVYARVDGESFGLYAEGLTNARALLEAGTSQVRLILGAGSEANDSVAGRFFIQKGLDIAGLYLNSEDEEQDFGFTIQSNGTITAHAKKLSGFYLTFS